MTQPIPPGVTAIDDLVTIAQTAVTNLITVQTDIHTQWDLGNPPTKVQKNAAYAAILPLVQALRRDAQMFKPLRYAVASSTDDGYVNVDVSMDGQPRVWGFTVMDSTIGAPVYVTDDQADAYTYASNLNGALQL